MAASSVIDDPRHRSARDLRTDESRCGPIGAAVMQDAIGRLSDRLGDCPLDLGAFGPDIVTFAALASAQDPALKGWLARESRFQDGMDRKAQGAFLIGRLTSGLVEPLAGLFLSERMVPRSRAHDVGVSFGENDEGSLRCTLHIAHDRDALRPAAWLSLAEGQDGLRRHLHALLIDLLEPVVERLRAETGLSLGAYWRLVADTVAYKFLGVGSRLGLAERARSEGMALIGETGSPLNNGKTGYIEIAPPDCDATATHWFITRGGCCRYYTCEGGEICSVCVLREPQERDALLLAHLVRLRAEAS